MCGIVGLIGPQKDLIYKMNSSQIHRGPDDEGYYFYNNDSLAFGMRRLSIIDVDGGKQPMLTPEGDLCIVFNGEIYNAPRLRLELQAQGCRFQTDRSDTEVLLYLYKQYGPQMLSHLNGMFAFVIHDTKKRILFGARDRLGIKPLYYALAGHRFAFASELKSLRSVPWISFGLNQQAVFDYLSFQCVPSPNSIFDSIYKLPAATCFQLNLSNFSFSTDVYWKPKFYSTPKIKESELPMFIRSELVNAVKRWTLSDVPLACSLSGGIDSSTIVGVLAKNLKLEGIQTYSLGFSDAPELDETHLAKLVASKWNTQHHEIILNADDLLSELDSMIFHLDEPYAGGLPSWFIFKHMAKSVKVALTGTGGDELFGNYGKWIPYLNHKAKIRTILANIRSGSHIKDLLKFRKAFFYQMYYRHSLKKHLLQPHFFTNLRPSENLIEKYWQEIGTCDPRDSIPAIDLRIQLPEEFLHMTDRFSMAHSLEARTPFLDHEFVENILCIPAFQRTDSKQLKHLLIKSVEDLLPPELLSAPKRGFVLPMARWLRTKLHPQVEYYLGESYLEKQGIFKPYIYKKFVSAHMQKQKDYSWQIWTLLMFQLWYKEFFTQSNNVATSNGSI